MFSQGVTLPLLDNSRALLRGMRTPNMDRLLEELGNLLKFNLFYSLTSKLQHLLFLHEVDIAENILKVALLIRE